MDLPSGPAVVLTRQANDNQSLAAALQDRGIPVVQVPCVETRYTPMDTLPEGAAAIVFTSRHGVRGWLKCPGWKAMTSTSPVPLVCAVGPATATELREAGVQVDRIADPPRGAVLARMLVADLSPGARIAVFRGNLRVGDLDKQLTRAGMALEIVEVYRNMAPEVPELAPFQVAAVFVASPSAARRLLAVNPWLSERPFVAIGATTAAALEELGVARVLQAGREEEDRLGALCSAHARAVKGLMEEQ